VYCGRSFCKQEVCARLCSATDKNNTHNICLKVLTNNKKAVNESFQLKQVTKFSSASELKNFIVTKKLRAANVDSLEIGFYIPPFSTPFFSIFHP